MRSPPTHPAEGKPRAVLIGLGSQGREHLSALLDPDCAFHLAAVSDRRLDDQRFLQELSALPADCARAHPNAGLFHAVRHLGISAAIVATPPSSYKQLIPDLLEAGLHVLLEKPLGLDLAEAASHLKLARSKNLALVPAVQRRFHPSYQELRKALELVQPVEEALLQLWITHAPGGWRRNDGIGSLIDLGFHAIDMARDLFGDLRLRSAVLLDEGGCLCHSRNDSAARLLFQTESGTFLRIDTKRCAAEKRERFEASGNGRELIADRSSVRVVDHSGKVVHETSCSMDWTSAMRAQLDEFASACRNPAPSLSPTGGQTGLVTMRLLEEIYSHASTP